MKSLQDWESVGEGRKNYYGPAGFMFGRTGEFDVLRGSRKECFFADSFLVSSEQQDAKVIGCGFRESQWATG